MPKNPAIVRPHEKRENEFIFQLLAGDSGVALGVNKDGCHESLSVMFKRPKLSTFSHEELLKFILDFGKYSYFFDLHV